MNNKKSSELRELSKETLLKEFLKKYKEINETSLESDKKYKQYTRLVIL